MSDLLQNGPVRCFDIGGSKIVAADVNAAGNIDELARTPTPVNSFSEFTGALVEHCPTDSQPIGISIAGIIDPQSNVVKSANIPCISDRRLANELSVQLARPVHIINDANAFALAESSYGKAATHGIVLAIILGTGVGGGIVINGQVLSGQDGTAGEWGHGPACAVRTSTALPIIRCNCGQRGCIDTLGSARGLERLYQHLTNTTLDSFAILQAWENNEPESGKAVDVWLDVVGGALANTVNTIGPSKVAVGGGLANNARLIKALDNEVAERRLATQSTPLLYPAVNGPEQGLLGAAIHLRSSYSKTKSQSQ